MTDTFKVPAIPILSASLENDSNTVTTENEEQPSHTVTESEPPPTDSTPLVRHRNLQYDVPESSAPPPIEYTLEVVRNGTIIQNIDLSQRAYTVFGRAPDSDVVLEHPTISRYHAIIQYKSEFEHGQSIGLYLYDCGSTHGTFINKKRLEPKVYVRIKVGYVIKFGQSTRIYLVQGDAHAEEEAMGTGTGDDPTHEQMRQFHAKRARMLAVVRAKRENEVNETSQSRAEMDWGMGPDVDETAAAEAAIAAAQSSEELLRKQAEEEETKRKAAAEDLKNRMEYKRAKNDQVVLKEIMTRVDAASTEDDESKNEPFYLKDPKRALTTFFEREGAELVYDVEDLHFGSYRCTIKLPIVDDSGRSMQAECEEKHCKRKEIVNRCVLEACRILDEQGVLREGTAASSSNTPRVQQIKRQILEENDFYEEDEDTFYDRTGELEKKRLKRMEWAGHAAPEKPVENFQSLSSKLTEMYREQVDLEHKLEVAKQMEEEAAKKAEKGDRDIDELDTYIRQLKQGEKVNLKVKLQWKKRLLEIENEERQWMKLFKACKPKELDISTWRKQIREQAKENLVKKKAPVEKKEMMPPPPPSAPPAPRPPLPVSTPAEVKPIEPSPPPPPAKSSTTHRKRERSVRSSKDQYDDSEHYSDEKFSGWMPPENEQTGDGRTTLNDKYGY